MTQKKLKVDKIKNDKKIKNYPYCSTNIEKCIHMITLMMLVAQYRSNFNRNLLEFNRFEDGPHRSKFREELGEVVTEIQQNAVAAQV